MRRAIFVAALLASTPAFAAGDVRLGLDEVHTLTFKRPVATVYVGNPAIADITMIDARHAFVQGKGYGRTNFVALNQDGVQVFGTNITVTGVQSGNTVVLNRGAQRITLNCAGQRCEPTPMPGDGKDAYEPANVTAAIYQNTARNAAAASKQ
jgi:putative type II/III system pilus formation protein